MLCSKYGGGGGGGGGGQKERELSERRGAPLGDESRLEIGHEGGGDAATEGRAGPGVEQKSQRRGRSRDLGGDVAPSQSNGDDSRETPRVFNPRDARPANVPRAESVKSEQSSKQTHKIATHPVGRKGTNTERRQVRSRFGVLGLAVSVDAQDRTGKCRS